MAPRSIWRGAIGFGLVSIPVRLYKAVDEKAEGMAMHNLHRECGTRITMPKYCSTCKKQLAAGEIIKAYPIDEKAGTNLTLTDADLATLPLASLHQIQVEAFNKPIEDPRWFSDGEVYILSPEELGVKAFVLFATAMKDLGLVGFSKYSLSGKEHLCSVRAQDGLLLLQAMRWAGEIRDYGDLIPFATISEPELAMAKKFLSAMTKDIDLTSYKDEYKDAFQKLVLAKMAGETIVAPLEVKPAGGDIMEQLMASLKAMGPA